MEKHEVKLTDGEVITKVTSSSGWMVDQVTFTTNFGKVHGPFGGLGGSEKSCNPKRTKQDCYLHSITGASVRTQEKLGIVDLAFRWVSFDVDWKSR